MPNWWLIWAERIARVLAEAWLRSRPTGGTVPAAPADRDADLDPGAPVADAPFADPAPPGVLP